MADETPESAAESENAASATAAPTGVAALLNNKYLPLIVAVVVMPIMAWGGHQVPFIGQQGEAGSRGRIPCGRGRILPRGRSKWRGARGWRARWS